MTCVLLTPELFGPELGTTSATLGGLLAANGFTVQESVSPSGQDVVDCQLTTPAAFLANPNCSATHPVVLITEAGTVAEAVQCMRLGASDYLELNLAVEAESKVFATLISAAIERAIRDGRRNSPTVESSPTIMIGECLSMRRLMDQIDSIGDTQSAVLILGEPGTGKELIARSIHATSNRSTSPMITLNCAAVPAQLLEDELFGSVDALGAERLGLLETANGGTLFLDEVTELPLHAQSRLLQVINDGAMRPVGGSDNRPVDVRLLAATSRPLEKLVANDQFREDLYYRLSVFTLKAPALRERGEDILRLASAFLKKTTFQLNRGQLHFSTEAQDRMLQYHWPGNVRELVNAVERAVILADGTQIGAGELAIGDAPEPITNGPEDPQDQTSLEDYFVKFVTEHQDQLTETELAERLGISRKSLWERRQRLNIPRKKTKKRGPRRDTR